ncbi:hypothetical protein EDD85DRAFT_947660 [Armillaria nabsnona]|nr:hypothetical protein EDD85DRAFT_947660 [Armillaria nabsnona]
MLSIPPHFPLDTRRLRVAVNTHSWGRKNGFRLIGRTDFLSYSPNPKHLYRRILPENDIGSLQGRLLDGDLSVSPVKQKALGTDDIHEELQENLSTARILQVFTYLIMEAFFLFPSHTLNKLIEIGVAEDLNNTDHTEGVTPLDGVLDSMQSARELMLIMWEGNAGADVKIVFTLKAAMMVRFSLAERSGNWLPCRCKLNVT